MIKTKHTCVCLGMSLADNIKMLREPDEIPPRQNPPADFCTGEHNPLSVFIRWTSSPSSFSEADKIPLWIFYNMDKIPLGWNSLHTHPCSLIRVSAGHLLNSWGCGYPLSIYYKSMSFQQNANQQYQSMFPVPANSFVSKFVNSCFLLENSKLRDMLVYVWIATSLWSVDHWNASEQFKQFWDPVIRLLYIIIMTVLFHEGGSQTELGYVWWCYLPVGGLVDYSNAGKSFKSLFMISEQSSPDWDPNPSQFLYIKRCWCCCMKGATKVHHYCTMSDLPFSLRSDQAVILTLSGTLPNLIWSIYC